LLYNDQFNALALGAQQQQGATAPYWANYLANISNTPGTSLANQGANIAATNTLQNTLPQAYGGANMMYGLAQQAMPYGAAGIGSAQQGLNYANQGMGLAGQVANTAFDPQSALYARTQQQVQDQANAINAMYGLSQSPYGAGVANQAMSNFNIDWQNQQLQRQLQGSQAYQGALAGYGGAQQGYSNAEAGYGNMVNAIGKGVSGAYDLNTGAAQQAASNLALPYQTAIGQQQNYGNQLNAYNQGFAGMYGLDATTANMLQNYLALGQQGGQGAVNAASVNQAGQNQYFGQQQTLGAGTGAAIQGIGNTLSSPTIQGSLSNLFGGQPSTYAPGSQSYGYYSNPNTYYDPSTVNIPGQTATPY
jgi:hypothetical protein